MIPKYYLYRHKLKSIVRRGQKGTKKRPRLSVFRSNRLIYAQLIDDEKGQTLVAVSQKELKPDVVKDRKPQDRAALVGELLARKAVKKNIKQAVFDRRAYRYHGRVKQLAEGARKGGLKI